MALGLFGLGEIIANPERKDDRRVVRQRIRDLIPTWANMKPAFPLMPRGTAVGSVLGVLPGGGWRSGHGCFAGVLIFCKACPGGICDN